MAIPLHAGLEEATRAIIPPGLRSAEELRPDFGTSVVFYGPKGGEHVWPF